MECDRKVSRHFMQGKKYQDVFKKARYLLKKALVLF